MLLDRKKSEASDKEIYKFSWTVIGSDSFPNKIKSPSFIVPFIFSEWHVELDVTQSNSLKCCLQRHKNFGPETVAMCIKVTVIMNKKEDLKFERTEPILVFCGEQENSWEFNVEISKDAHKENWLCESELFLEFEMKPMNQAFSEAFWNSIEDAHQLSDSLSALYKSEIHHDLVLRVAEKEFKLHKFILAVRWPDLLSRLEVEESTDCVEIKETKDISVSAWDKLLSFAYSGRLDFMTKLKESSKWLEIYDLAAKYNLYRLMEKICFPSPYSHVVHLFQSYRTYLDFNLKDVMSEKDICELWTCDVPLQSASKNQHIKSMDVRCCIKKGSDGKNQLLLSITLDRIPLNNPVTIKYRMHVLDDSDPPKLTLLSKVQDSLELDEKCKLEISTMYRDDKKSAIYHKVAEPVSTWDEIKKYLCNRVECDENGKESQKQDLRLRLDLKVFDGESVHSSRNGECNLEFADGLDELIDDMERLYREGKYSDCDLVIGPTRLKTHKALLTVRSEVFRQHIEGESTLLGDCIRPRLYLLSSLMMYIYTSKVPVQSDESKAALFRVAETTNLKQLYSLLKKSDIVAPI